MIAIADNEKRVVVERMRDDVLIHVITQIAVESGADILVDGLEFDEDQRQAVNEADAIGPAIIVRRAQASQLD
jgi:hypothetical protein